MSKQPLHVGARVSREYTVDDVRVRQFGAVVEDFNPIHLDEAAAANSRFGRRISHGMLLAGFISGVLAEELPGPGTIYLSQSLKFVKPAFVGDSVTVTVEVIAIDMTRERYTLATTCTNSAGDLLLEGQALVWLPSA
jgi:3-hydroxybutyryl-CoA dehydratase